MRIDARITELNLSNPDSIGLFKPPEEDIVYAGIRKVNQVITCGYSKRNPFQALIVNIIIFLSLIILVSALAVQASI